MHSVHSALLENILEKNEQLCHEKGISAPHEPIRYHSDESWKALISKLGESIQRSEDKLKTNEREKEVESSGHKVKTNLLNPQQKTADRRKSRERDDSIESVK